MTYAPTAQSGSFVDTMAKALGWFSIGLGLVEVTSPRRLGGALGIERQSGWLRAHGVREIIAGLGILAAERPSAWLWARVTGDAIDLATLAPGLREDNRRRGFAALAAGAVAAIALADIYCAVQTGEEAGGDVKRIRDYSKRSGFPASPEQMRGAAVRTQTQQNWQ